MQCIESPGVFLHPAGRDSSVVSGSIKSCAYKRMSVCATCHGELDPHSVPAILGFHFGEEDNATKTHHHLCKAYKWLETNEADF